MTRGSENSNRSASLPAVILCEVPWHAALPNSSDLSGKVHIAPQPCFCAALKQREHALLSWALFRGAGLAIQTIW